MRTQKILYGVLFLLIILTLYLTLLIRGRDIPPQDTSDLALTRVEVLPDDNAYTYFADLSKLIYTPSNRKVLSEYISGKDVDETEIKEIIEKNSDAFLQVEKGLHCKICQVPEVIDFNSAFPYIQDWLQIGKLLRISIKYNLSKGNYTKATDECIILLRFSDLILYDSEALIHYLVGIAVINMGLTEANNIAIDNNTPAQSLVHLYQTVNNLRSPTPGYIRGIKNEYKFFEKLIDSIYNGDASALDGSGLPGYGFPTMALNLSRHLHYFFQPEKTKHMSAEFFRTAITNTTYCYSKMVPYPEFPDYSDVLSIFTKPNAVGKILYNLTIPAVEGSLEKNIAIEAYIAAIKLIIACRQYCEVNGSFPASLELLTPEYIAEVPKDPYDGLPFRYIPDKKLIYAIGTNLTDDGGSTNKINNTKRNYGKFRNIEDIVFNLIKDK